MDCKELLALIERGRVAKSEYDRLQDLADRADKDAWRAKMDELGAARLLLQRSSAELGADEAGKMALNLLRSQERYTALDKEKFEAMTRAHAAKREYEQVLAIFSDLLDSSDPVGAGDD